MLLPDMAQELKSYLPERFHQRAVVAGGYAASPAMAQDIDLWVLDTPVAEWDRVEKEIRRFLVVQGYLSPGAPETQNFLRQYRADYDPDHATRFNHYEEHPGEFRVIVDPVEVIVEGGRSMPLQIILTSQPSALALLRTFDVSTHQIAYALTNPEVPMRASTYTVPFDTPRVVNFDRPERTMERIRKIAERYGFEPHRNDVDALRQAMKEVA